PQSSPRPRFRSRPPAPPPPAAPQTPAGTRRRSPWPGRPPAPGRSARPPSGPDERRSGPLLRQSRVELPREETCRRLKDLIGPPQLPVFPFQLCDAPALLGGCARPPSVVDFRLLDPVAQRLDPNPQLTAHPGDHAEALAIFGDRLAYHADRALPQLRRVPPLAGVLARVRCGHVTPSIPKKWSLHRTQGSSGCVLTRNDHRAQTVGRCVADAVAPDPSAALAD